MHRYFGMLIGVAVALTGAALPASAGTKVGPEFRVSEVYRVDRPAVASFPDGGFVVVWQSLREYDPSEGNSLGIYGQRFAADGTPVGDEFRANTQIPGNQSHPSIAILGDGGFVVAWQSY